MSLATKVVKYIKILWWNSVKEIESDGRFENPNAQMQKYCTWLSGLRGNNYQISRFAMDMTKQGKLKYPIIKCMKCFMINSLKWMKSDEIFENPNAKMQKILQVTVWTQRQLLSSIPFSNGHVTVVFWGSIIGQKSSTQNVVL